MAYEELSSALARTFTACCHNQKAGASDISRYLANASPQKVPATQPVAADWGLGDRSNGAIQTDCKTC